MAEDFKPLISLLGRLIILKALSSSTLSRSSDAKRPDPKTPPASQEDAPVDERRSPERAEPSSPPKLPDDFSLFVSDPPNEPSHDQKPDEIFRTETTDEDLINDGPASEAETDHMSRASKILSTCLDQHEEFETPINMEENIRLPAIERHAIKTLIKKGRNLTPSDSSDLCELAEDLRILLRIPDQPSADALTRALVDACNKRQLDLEDLIVLCMVRYGSLNNCGVAEPGDRVSLYSAVVDLLRRPNRNPPEWSDEDEKNSAKMIPHIQQRLWLSPRAAKKLAQELIIADRNDSVGGIEWMIILFLFAPPSSASEWQP